MRCVPDRCGHLHHYEVSAWLQFAGSHCGVCHFGVGAEFAARYPDRWNPSGASGRFGLQATLYAQSFLAQQGVAMPLHVQHQQGEFENGRFRWMLETRPYENSPRSPDGAQLLELILSVRWGDEPDQSLQWRTLRFVRLQPPGDEL